MSGFFFFLMFVNLLGIIPFFVIFIVMAAKRHKKAIWGFLALGCVVGTILFSIIGAISAPKVSSNTGVPSKPTEVATGAFSKVDAEETIKETVPARETQAPTQKPTSAPTQPVPTQKPTERPTIAPTQAPATQAPTLSYEEMLEQYKGLCSEIAYKDLARNPEKHKGENFKFRGQVIQVVEPSRGTTVELRVNVTEEKSEYSDFSWWDDTVYCTVTVPKNADRILEDDIITFWGQCEGLKTYDSVLGQKISIPSIKIFAYDIEE